MTHAVPSMVRFVRQSGHHADCSLSAIAMISGVLYEDALAAALPIQPAVLQAGLNWPQIRAVVKRLGLKTRLTRHYDITDATGLLNVRRRSDKEDHLVLLWEGRIVDGHGELWLDATDYLKHYTYEARALLVTED